MQKHTKKKTDESSTTPPETGSPTSSAAGGSAATASDASTAAPVSPAAPAPSTVELELTAAKEKYLRLMADFENFRKRQTREREDFIRRATEGLGLDLLPAIDHLELAIANAKDKNDPFVKGVQMVADQFLAALAKYDIKPFHAVGENFDPTRHEALTQQPSEQIPAHHVMLQLRRGYMVGGRLLRAAQVIISSGPKDTLVAPSIASPEASPVPLTTGSEVEVGDDE